MRRRKLLVALAGLVGVVAAGVVMVWPREDRLTRENFDRIRKGMTGAQVKALVGPPGDFSTGPVKCPHLLVVGTDADFRLATDTDVRLDREEWTWATDDGFTFVDFNADGRVQTCSFLSGRRQKQTIVDNLLWRAKRQWHRWFPE